MKPFQKIYQLVSQIPKGKVMTYGQVAKIAGVSPRVVGFALHANKDPKNIPCHRVVNKNGKLAKGYAFGGSKKQREKLLQEQVLFVDKNTVDLKACLYRFPSSTQI